MGEVVTLKELGNGIVLISMEDRQNQNTFTDGLIHGLIKCYEQIKANPTYKVVIMTGYDNYFSCGGTKEDLMRIHRGEVTFNELQWFTSPIECEIPVISAMQGHGIGGGFAFGLYADFSILGRENIYTTNFMKYGFTPGMGVTLIVPERLGSALGNEMMFSAKNYRGAELKDRGISLKVCPKNEVMSEALELAKSLAEKPRTSLLSLKFHLNQDLRAKLPKIIDQELKMHELTFHHPEVVERIESFFGK